MNNKIIYNNELIDEEPAPSLMPISNDIISKCECFEQEKLILNKSKFFFKPEIDSSNFYKVVYGINDFEINFQKLLKKRNEYYRHINIIHSNFSNFVDYIEELLSKLKKISKNKVLFEFIMNIINKNNDFNQGKNHYNLININAEFNFYFINNKEEIYIKKKYVHNNVLEIITQFSGMQNILNEIELIIKEIKNRNINKNILNGDSDNSDLIIKKRQRKIQKINLSKNKNKIIRFKKRIGIHKNSCQMIKELSCGNFISCGLDGQLILYDDNLNKIDSICITNDWIYSISESLGAENEILVCCPEYIYIVTINNNKLTLKEKHILIKDTANYLTFPVKKNEMILLGDKSITKYIGALKELDQENKGSKNYIYEINNMGFTCGLKISDNIVVAVSNKIMRNGEDSLKFIKITNGNEINQKQEYHSFNTSPNSLMLIEHKFKSKNRNKKNKNVNESIKLLLCGCTKYLREQRNGILIVTPNQKNVKDNFYETGDFEVFCFCLLQNNNTMNNGNINKYNDYFLVGGYDSINNQGLIKLYKIIYDYNHIENIKIEFVQNVSNLSMFKFPINCIIQSSKNEEIIASSWDGTVNLFTSPNPEIFFI